MLDIEASDRRAKLISALVEDMIRLAPLVPPPMTRPEPDVRGWAQDLALLANYIYDAAEAAVDCELATAAVLPTDS